MYVVYAPGGPGCGVSVVIERIWKRVLFCGGPYERGPRGGETHVRNALARASGEMRILACYGLGTPYEYDKLRSSPSLFDPTRSYPFLRSSQAHIPNRLCVLSRNIYTIEWIALVRTQGRRILRLT